MLPNGVYGHEHDANSLERQLPDVVVPTFYVEKQLNKKKSDEAQRSIYDEYEAVKYFIPGDNTTEHKERVTPEIIRRFYSRYEAFKAGLEQTNGMPLDAWYKLANYPGLLEEMRAMRIRSVEDLASIGDDVAMRAPWGYDWRNHAKAEIAAREKKETMTAANAELQAKLDAETAARQAMEKRLADMEAQLSAAAKPQRKAG